MLDTGAWSDQITSDIVLAIGGFRRFGCRWLGHRGGSGMVMGLEVVVVVVCRSRLK